VTKRKAAAIDALLQNFSWVTDELAGSAHPGYRVEELVRIIDALKRQGIGCIVSLAPFGGGVVSAAGLTHIELRCPDMGVPALGELAPAIAGALRALAEGKKILVHCGAGYGRTGLFLACLLVAQGMSAPASIELVRRRRPGSIETSDQEAMVGRWAAYRAIDAP